MTGGPAPSTAYKVTAGGKRMTVIDTAAEPFEKFSAAINTKFGRGRVESIEPIQYRRVKT